MLFMSSNQSSSSMFTTDRSSLLRLRAWRSLSISTAISNGVFVILVPCSISTLVSSTLSFFSSFAFCSSTGSSSPGDLNVSSTTPTSPSLSDSSSSFLALSSVTVSAGVGSEVTQTHLSSLLALRERLRSSILV